MKEIYSIHGDITIVKVKSIPEDSTKKQWKKGFVLERGEGIHTHTIEDECEIYEYEGTMYLKVTDPIKIDHEEHGAQVLEPGIYRKEIEQVFDYEEMESKRVVD